MASASLGSVTFEYPLRWIDKARPTVLGSDVRTRGGMVRVRPSSTPQTAKAAKLQFEWTSWSQVETLYSMWLTGGQYTLNPEGVDGDTYTVEFAADNGISIPEHEAWGHELVKAHVEGENTDIFRGELNLIIVS